ncbi:hypothetical protein [Parafilimonas sp.]|uniref:hypothetical protein n=1 Tax=Parafilimonas sp. TaxID=1969739 RepID=UPI0039E6A328
MFLLSPAIQAQVDTGYVDTTGMHHIDTAEFSAGEETATYNDEDDGYVDTTVKHIYDTSQYFFNWKTNPADPFVTEKISQHNLADAMVNDLKKADDFWYIPAIEKLETRLRNDPAFRDSLLKVHNRKLLDERQTGILYQPWFNRLLWIVIIAVFAAAVIYFLVQNKVRIFAENAASSADENDGEAQEGIFGLSYTRLIQNAEKQSDYRLAIRLMFLQTLKLLHEVNAIQYQPGHTDLDYLQQLHGSAYYNEFFSAVRSYEYVWFGRFDVPAGRYTVIKNDFIRLQHKIR